MQPQSARPLQPISRVASPTPPDSYRAPQSARPALAPSTARQPPLPRHYPSSEETRAVSPTPGSSQVSPPLSAASSFAPPPVANSPSSAAWRGVTAAHGQHGQHGGQKTGAWSPARPRPGPVVVGSMAQTAMRMSWKTVAPPEDDPMEKSKGAVVQPPQRIRAVSPPPAPLCGSGHSWTTSGHLSPMPMAGCFVGLAGAAKVGAGPVGPMLQSARPMVMTPAMPDLLAAPCVPSTSVEASPAPQPRGRRSPNSYAEESTQQEVERSTHRESDLLSRSGLPLEGLRTQPEEHQSLQALRRDLEQQQQALAEVVRQQAKFGDFERRVEAALDKFHADFDAAQQLQAMDCAGLRVEWEQQRAQWGALESAVGRIQEERPLRGGPGTQEVQEVVQLLRGDVEALREEAAQRAQSAEEVEVLHQDVMRSTGSLSRIVEDVSAAVAATERSLREAMEETKQAMSKVTQELRSEQRDLRTLVDTVCQDMAHLRATADCDRHANANAAGKAEEASSCVQEVLQTAGERLGRLERSLQRLEGSQAQHCGEVPPDVATGQDIQDVWDVLHMLKASLEARESALRADADAQCLEAENDPAGLLAHRVFSLEEQTRQQRAQAARMGVLADGLEQLLIECSGGGPPRSGAAALQVCSIATPRPSEVGLGGRTSPAADLVQGKGEQVFRAAKAYASAGMGFECEAENLPDLTPSLVSRLPTPQVASGGPVHSSKDCIRV